jgi:hypothetical protein
MEGGTFRGVAGLDAAFHEKFSKGVDEVALANSLLLEAAQEFPSGFRNPIAEKPDDRRLHKPGRLLAHGGPRNSIPYGVLRGRLELTNLSRRNKVFSLPAAYPDLW